jgi:DNA-binding MarR family transcriptional regulator
MMLQQTNDLFAEAKAARMAAAGFSEVRPAHQKVLDGIGDGAKLSVLADRAKVSKQAMSGLVQHLVQGRYIERSSDAEDRRAVILRLTPAGVAARDFAWSIQYELLGEVRKAVGKKRIRELRRTLSELDSVLEAKISSTSVIADPPIEHPTEGDHGSTTTPPTSLPA